MNRKVCGWKRTVLFICLITWICSMTVSADGLSGDNSLSTLGLLVEGATVTPEFEYSTIEYNVTVPAGTQEIVLDPVTSNPNAEIVSITGTELTNGEGTVVITVRAENGSECGYYLYVTSEAAAPEPAPQPVTEKETQPPTEKETEPETEDPRYVRVDRNSLEEAEKTIETLKTETASYRDRLRLLMKILYGLIAFCVVLLFVVINLILKKKDLKAELREYAAYGYPPVNEGGQFTEEGGGLSQGEAPYGYDGYDIPEDHGNSAAYAPMDGENENYGQEYEAYDLDNVSGQEHEDYNLSDGSGQETAGEPEKAGQTGPENSEVQAGERLSQEREQEPEAALRDDPAEVPKPSKTKRRSRKMPEYREPQPSPKYQPSERKSGKKDVEITMIDL